METETNIFSPDFRKNDYEFYKRLRADEPAHSFSLQGGRTGWLISRYDDVLELLKSSSFIKDQSKVFGPISSADAHSNEAKLFHNMMLNVDPPDHTRLRRLIQPSFNPKEMLKLAPRIEQIADSLLKDMEHIEGSFDLIDAFAFPLPIIVISELLGVPVEDRHKFRKWSNTIVSASENEHNEFAEDVKAFVEYLDYLIKERRENPQNDLITGLIHAEEEGDKLQGNELYSMIFLLIIAGHETTVNLIGNGMYALFEHPKQLELLKNDLSLTETAIEEMLRFYSPVDSSTARWADEDIVLHGKTIQKGDLVIASISSANRDERKFENPHLLDITRKPNPHIAFGYGIHFCLGAPLARLEGSIAFRKLLRAFPHITPAGSLSDLEWRSVFLLRGLKELPVLRA